MAGYTGADPTAFDFQRIRYAKDGFVATVTINRPDVLNAFDFVTLREMARAFEDAAWDDGVAVVVVTGAGDRAFCTGADLKEQEQFLHRPHDYWKWFGAFQEMHDRLRNIGKPTIARLNGMVVGGGNELNMACDLAIAADHVTIRQVGMARGSVPAGGATQWLPLIVGDRRAREILWLCEPIPAATALDWGLVNQVVPAAELDTAVARMAQKLHDKLPECTRYTKQQTNFWRELSWSLTVGHARDWLSLHASAPETAEGLAAFYAKRPVDYAGLRAARQAAGGAGGGPAGSGGAPPESFQGAYGGGFRLARRCPACGAQDLPAGHRYCGHCGGPLPPEPPVVA